MEYQIKETHITDIKVGDTILHNGKIQTVSGNNLKQSDGMGITLFGDSYVLGYKPVQKVLIKQHYKDQISFA